MIELQERVAHDAKFTATVTLPIDKRIKSRLRVTLDDGRDAGILLARGESLQHGDKLASSDGTVVMVQAAKEKLSIVRCSDRLLFARAAYHLGNRHVPVEIVIDQSHLDVTGVITYLHDHVLDDMLRGLGLEVQSVTAAFNPEAGAYGGGHHHHH